MGLSVRLPRPDSFAQYQERKLCLCALHDCSTTSGVRTAKRNKAKGGAKTSKHKLSLGGWADDLVPDHNTKQRRDSIVADARAFGLWAKDEGHHVHIQGKAPTR